MGEKERDVVDLSVGVLRDCGRRVCGVGVSGRVGRKEMIEASG